MKILRKTAKAIFYLCLAFSALLFAVMFILNLKIGNKFKVGTDEDLSFNTFLPISAESRETKSANGSHIVGESYKVDLKLFGVIPYSTVDVEVVDDTYVAVLGQPFGMKIYTEGVLVVDSTPVKTKSGKLNPAIAAGLKMGDYVISVDGEKIECNEDLSETVEKSGGKALDFLILQNGKKRHIKVTPVLDSEKNIYRIGIWVRDSSAGVGTLTFYSPAANVLCGLGHPICDEDTEEILSVNKGQMVTADIISVKKGKKGEPGELEGRFTYDDLGEINLNCNYGVFGKSSIRYSVPNLTQIAHKQEITDGEAQILCTVDGSTPKLYSCTVKHHSNSIFGGEQNLTVTVTDGNLLEQTGGIVQGMSGSPIIQNGKLIGAITHVLVDDPTTGYAIFAENMLETAQSLASDNKLKDAS